MPFTTEEIEQLAVIRIFPDSVKDSARETMVRFVQENQSIQTTENNRALEIQSVGNILFWSLSGDHLDAVFREHQMHFGEASVECARTLVNQFVAQIHAILNENHQNVSSHDN